MTDKEEEKEKNDEKNEEKHSKEVINVEISEDKAEKLKTVRDVIDFISSIKV